MSNGTQTATLAGVNAKDLFDELMSRPVNQRIQATNNLLVKRETTIEELLPDFMKGQATRLIKRGMLYMQSKSDLQAVPPDQFVECVLAGAEMGFALDGKMCYVVKYKDKYQCQLSYMALVAVAKRMKTIRGVDADVVASKDTFQHERRDGGSHLLHTYEFGVDRSKIIGAYCRIFLPDGEWVYEVMDRVDLDRIQERSKAAASGKGPWLTDPNEMRKKTVLRRALKIHMDDPGLVRVMELTEEPGDVEPVMEPEQPKRKTIDDLTDSLRKPDRREQVKQEMDSSAATDAPAGGTEAPDARPVDQHALDNLATDAKAAPDLTAVSLVEDKYRALPLSDEQDREVTKVLEARREEIRAARGGKKDKQGTLPQ